MNSYPLKTGFTNRRPLGVDLFSGAGGLSLGFEQAGFDVVAAVEIDPIHCAVHEFNFPLCASICADACTITATNIRARAGLGSRKVDVVFGGAPCQGFSMIGKRALDDPRNALLRHFCRLVVELDADYLVFENVRGLTVGEHRRLLDELIEAFDKEQYSVRLPYRVLNAAEYGVPQDRQRLFLLGAKRGFPLPDYPLPSSHRTTVWEAIGDIPDAESYESLVTSDVVDHVTYKTGSSFARIMRGLVADIHDYSYLREFAQDRLTSSMRTQHTDISRKRFLATTPGKVELVSRFFKLDPDGVCNTLRAGTGSDRGAFTSPRPIHPHEPRVITVREAARLHSYPDWFRFHSTKWHGFRQVGNSVPPLLGRAVAAKLIECMGIRPTKPKTTLRLDKDQLLYLNMSEASARYDVAHDVVGRRLRAEVANAR